MSTTSATTRQSNVSQARNRVFNGVVGLGNGLDFIIGDGTVMF